MSAHCSIFLNESQRKKNNYSTLGLSWQKIYAEKSQQIFFVSWYIYRLRSYKLNYLYRWYLDIQIFTDIVIGIYKIW